MTPLAPGIEEQRVETAQAVWHAAPCAATCCRAGAPQTPLAPAQMPEELAYDATIAELRAAVKDVQPAFIEAHKAADAARRAAE